MKTGYVYALRDPAGHLRYAGSSGRTPLERFRGHRHSARADPLACPLYRECGGNLDNWSVVQLAELTYDEEVTPHALKDAEQAAISALRARGEPLLNKNRAVDPDAARREYMREWRRAHPTYMADASREHRERRRQRAAAAAAGGTTPLTAFAPP